MTETEWLTSGNATAMYGFLLEETILFRTRWQGSVLVRRFLSSERKLRLFACACCYRIMHLIPTEASRQVVVVAERYAEGLADKTDLEAALAASVQACQERDNRRRNMGSVWTPVEGHALNAVSRVFRTEEAGRGGAIRAAALAWATEAVIQAWQREAVEVAKLQNMDATCLVEAPATEAWTRAALEHEEAKESVRQAALLHDIVGNPFQIVTIDRAWLRWNAGCVEQIARRIYDDRRFADLPVLADALEEAGCDDAAILGHCRQPGDHARGCWVLDSLLGRE
jgi:hypothetical protein